jgi:hypothetical protein
VAARAGLVNGPSIRRIVDSGGLMKHRREDIAAKAYEIWEREGRPANKADEHWLRAERELCGETSVPASEPGESQLSRADPRPSSPVTRAGSLSHEADGSRGGRKMRGAGHAGGRQGGSPGR